MYTGTRNTPGPQERQREIADPRQDSVHRSLVKRLSQHERDWPGVGSDNRHFEIVEPVHPIIREAPRYCEFVHRNNVGPGESAVMCLEV